MEILLRKPGALPGATALAQAKAAGKFTVTHDAWWAGACKAHGDVDGTRALIEVLLLHRHLRAEHVQAGLRAALSVGAWSADVVALEARKAADGDRDPTVGPAGDGVVAGRPFEEMPNVTSLLARRVRAALPADSRPAPDVSKYDRLLPSRAGSAT